jgi:tripartite-type tricarboxylate transporter receptor subunit TctC
MKTRDKAKHHAANLHVASLLAITAVAVLFGGWHGAARADSAEEFYRGKIIRIAVGSAAGGGYDIYTRAIARIMTKYVPGHPKFIISNMPGGGGLLAPNYLNNVAARDGLEIGVIERGAVFERLFNPKDSKAQFDVRKLNWIGSPEQEIGFVFLRLPSPIRTIDDLNTNELVVSATTHTASTSIYPRMLNKLFGTRFKIIEGYRSSQEALFALDRGEVEGHLSGASSGVMRNQVGPWIDTGKVKIILQLGLKQDLAFSDAPGVTELAKNVEDRQILDLLFAQQEISYPFVAPPDVPADRIAALRAAFDATMKDPDFLADAKKQRLQIDPLSGAEIDAFLTKVESTPPSVLQRFTDLLHEQ